MHAHYFSPKYDSPARAQKNSDEQYGGYWSAGGENLDMVGAASDES